MITDNNIGTIWFHIGMEKTGTSALQMFLSTNKDILAQSGILYPESVPFIKLETQRTAMAHGNGYFLRGCKGPFMKLSKEEKDSIKFILQQAKPGKNVLVSDELFKTNLKEILSYFIRDSVKIRIIVYLRRQDEYTESMWSQAVKDGFCSEPIKNELGKMKKIYTCNYLSFLRDLESLAGKENVIARVYEKARFRGEQRNLYSDFMDIFSLPLTDQYCLPQKNINPSLDINLLEVKRILNRVTEDRELLYHTFPSVELMNLLSSEKLNSGVLHNASILSFAERKEFMSNFEEENRQVAKEFFGYDGDLFSTDYGSDDNVKKQTDREFIEAAILVFGDALCRQQKLIENMWLRVFK